MRDKRFKSAISLRIALSSDLSKLYADSLTSKDFNYFYNCCFAKIQFSIHVARKFALK